MPAASNLSGLSARFPGSGIQRFRPAKSAPSTLIGDVAAVLGLDG